MKIAVVENAEFCQKHEQHVVEVGLNYPSLPESIVDTVEIDLVDVRAAAPIRVTYDFDRDGWVITMEKTERLPSGCNTASGEWLEVGFVAAWQTQTN